MIFLTRNSEASECTMHFQLPADSPPMGPGPAACCFVLQDRRGTPARPAGASPDQLLLRAALLPARRPLVCPGDDRHALELRAANHAQHSLCHFRRVLHRQEQTPRRGRRVCRWCCDQPGSPSLLFRDDRAAKSAPQLRARAAAIARVAPRRQPQPQLQSRTHCLWPAANHKDDIISTRQHAELFGGAVNARVAPVKGNCIRPPHQAATRLALSRPSEELPRVES